MAKHNDGKCGLHLFDDWFYVVLVLLVGFGILGINLGFISITWLAYWPLLLIAVALKELLERR